MAADFDPSAVSETGAPRSPARERLDRLRLKLGPFGTLRFLQFALVGATGVGVNLFALAIFAELAGLQSNLASAAAIEVSICSNFLLNDAWTFRDRRSDTAWLSRFLRFHLIAVLGGLLQWSIFVLSNLLWAELLGLGDAHSTDPLQRWVLGPIFAPRDVGALKYLSQLFGIGAAMFWNYLANRRWTWRRPR